MVMRWRRRSGCLTGWRLVCARRWRGFDGAGLWEVDGATSMTAWLADRARVPRRRAAGWASRSRKLAGLPVTSRAYADGVLSSGQVEAICANLDRETVGLFAEHESELVPTLAGLSADEVATAMRRWREHATADREPKPERPQELHLSRGLDSRWVLDGHLNPAGKRNSSPTPPSRSPPQTAGSSPPNPPAEHPHSPSPPESRPRRLPARAQRHRPRPSARSPATSRRALARTPADPA
jgi:Domain of unknown function (DUF222)